MELRATQRREYIRVRVALGVGFTPISAEECRRLGRERNERANPAWPEVEVPQCSPGSETEGLLEALRVINEKLDFLLTRLCAGEPRRHKWRGTTVDVSGGGLCLASEAPVAVGQHLDLSLVLPTWPEIRLELLGQVRLVEAPEPGAEEKVFKLGVAFVGMSEIDRDRLVRYIFQKQRECLRHGLKQA
jgi:c-di-GMP-binding flagellar brake protein YcgR